MMRPATIFLGVWRRGDGLARAEEGSGEESARASAFSFGEMRAGYQGIKVIKSFVILSSFLILVLRVSSIKSR